MWLAAVIFKRKPTPGDEPKKETTSDQQSGGGTTPGDKPKKETTSDEQYRDETTPGDDPKKETISEVAPVGIPACIGTVGLTGANTATGSIAAKVNTAPVIAHGGGKAVLPSVGAAGMSRDTKIGQTSALSKVGLRSSFLVSKRVKAKIMAQKSK